MTADAQAALILWGVGGVMVGVFVIVIVYGVFDLYARRDDDKERLLPTPVKRRRQ